MKDILVYLLVALAMAAGIVIAATNPAFAQIM